ncbi:MAG: hypothetical protein M3Y54_16345 [Bacteroidota bacterium]|nr:hypothetical protein [Bacteroidota bacterium]
MIISSLHDGDGSRCTLTLEPEGWLRATWRGFIDSEEALRGAANYLNKLRDLRNAYLLNDNVALMGPWFDSVEWLERIWLPQARELGLRYVAHVVQADSLSDIITVTLHGSSVQDIEVQIFQQVHEAEAWLRACQHERQAAPTK